MARNKFDVDEVLETPFDIRHLKRSLVYAAKYKKRIAISLILSALDRKSTRLNSSHPSSSRMPSSA